MKHPKGLIPIIIVIFITIIAGGIIGMAWYYEENKDEAVANTNTATNQNININAAFNTNLTVNENTNASTTDTSDWQTYYSKDNQNNHTYVTEDWHDFHTYGEATTNFTLQLPNGWRVDSTVIYDKNNNKVGEFSPGSVHLSEGQSCSNQPQPDPTGWSIEEISRGEIDLGNYTGLNIIQKSAVDGGDIPYWFVNRYCLEDGDRAFLVNFYELELGQENQNFFDHILSTLKFLPETTNSQTNTNQSTNEEVASAFVNSESPIESQELADPETEYDMYVTEKQSFSIDEIEFPENWVTYTNDEYRFSVKYPEEYTKHELPRDVSFDNVPSAIPHLSVTILNPDHQPPPEDGDMVTWTISEYLHGDRWNEYKGVVVINGLQATHISGDGVSGLYDEYLINNNGQIYRISASHFKNEEKDKDWILDAFFSSFQFLDSITE